MAARAVSLRQLPAIDSLLQRDDGAALRVDYGHALAVEALRLEVERARAALRQGEGSPAPADLVAAARRSLEVRLTSSLQPVVNATGVILHTNLGRAVLSDEARVATLAAAGYGTLEYDLEAGQRGRRDDHLGELLRLTTGAEAGLVVNNNAAAVLLALTGLARGGEVIISRSQLIEIGGGFRIPEVLAQSGAHLVEVGTTNRTHLADIEAAVSERTALLLRAHASNFKLVGFTTAPTLAEMVAVGRRHGLPVLDDLGSGALLDTRAYGLGHEPTVQESLQAGAALVAFSGDKLLGGPQAGILVGARESIETLRRHPLARALRPDKLCLAGLHATLVHYARGEAAARIPVWRMIAAADDELRRRAEGWAAQVGGQVIAARSTVGGGSLPEETLPTWALALDAGRADELARALRRSQPPVIGRIEAGRVLLDPRSVLPEQDPALLSGVRQALDRP